MECGDYGATGNVFVRTESAKEQEPENVIALGMSRKPYNRVQVLLVVCPGHILPK